MVIADLDATYVKARENGRILAVAVIVAVALLPLMGIRDHRLDDLCSC
jgi:transposase-like protein